jgi:hypothetical protein
MPNGGVVCTRYPFIVGDCIREDALVVDRAAARLVGPLATIRIPGGDTRLVGIIAVSIMTAGIAVLGAAHKFRDGEPLKPLLDKPRSLVPLRRCSWFGKWIDHGS